MIQFVTAHAGAGISTSLDAMYRERKHVFVDLLGWDVPVVGGEFEIDEFDTSDATYLLKEDDQGHHLGSIRLLPSTGPHVLGSIFPGLCDGPVPSSPAIMEISRGCLSPRMRATQRRQVRDELISGAVLFALLHGIRAFSCVADSGWLSQILALGWDCEMLGEPRLIDGVSTGAIRISVSSGTIEQLRAAGTYRDTNLVPANFTRQIAA